MTALRAANLALRFALELAALAALGALYGLVLAFPGTRHFFDLAPSAGVLVVAAVGSAIAIAGLVLTDDRFVPEWARRAL